MKELSELVEEVVLCADDWVDEVLVVVESVEGTVVEDVLGTVDDELSVVEVVVTSVDVGAGLELELELVLELELELELVVGTVDELVSVVLTEVVGSMLEEVVGAADEVEAGSEVLETGSEVVVLSWRFTTRSRLAIFSSSSFRASAALMSVGKMPSRNLVEKACKAS